MTSAIERLCDEPVPDLDEATWNDILYRLVFYAPPALACRVLAANHATIPAACINRAFSSALSNDWCWPLLKALLEHPAVHDVCDIMYKAAQAGDLEAVQYLLYDKRVDPYGPTWSAVEGAARGGHAEIMQLLLADPRVDPSVCNNVAVCTAACSGSPDVLALLLADPRVDPSDRCQQAIRYAGCVECARLLLADPRVDPSAKDQEAILNAIKGEKVENVQLLLADKRVVPSDECLLRAVEKKLDKVVALLLADRRVDPSFDYQFCLGIAVDRNAADILRMLLADARVKPSVGILSRAVQYNRWQCLQQLLADSRIIPNHQLLCEAIRYGHGECTRLLLADARVDSTAYGNKALLIAMMWGGEEAVKLLLEDPRVNGTGRLCDYISGLARKNMAQLVLSDHRTDVHRVLRAVLQRDKYDADNLALVVFELIRRRLPVSPQPVEHASPPPTRTGLDEEQSMLATAIEAVGDGDDDSLVSLLLRNVMLEHTRLLKRIFDQTVQQIFSSTK